jgi:hypothetical protein
MPIPDWKHTDVSRWLENVRDLVAENIHQVNPMIQINGVNVRPWFTLTLEQKSKIMRGEKCSRQF